MSAPPFVALNLETGRLLSLNQPAEDVETWCPRLHSVRVGACFLSSGLAPSDGGLFPLADGLDLCSKHGAGGDFWIGGTLNCKSASGRTQLIEKYDRDREDRTSDFTQRHGQYASAYLLLHAWSS